jgi:hypothetical protein
MVLESNGYGVTVLLQCCHLVSSSLKSMSANK